MFLFSLPLNYTLRWLESHCIDEKERFGRSLIEKSSRIFVPYTSLSGSKKNEGGMRRLVGHVPVFINYCLYSSICTWNLQSLVFCVRFMFSFFSFYGPIPVCSFCRPSSENAFLRTNSMSSSVDGMLPRLYVVVVPSAPSVHKVCLVPLENVSFSLVLIPFPKYMCHVADLHTLHPGLY